MKITCHGAAQEVGASCIEIVGSKHILLDCGVKLGPEGTSYPSVPKNLKDVDAVFLSHAHLDHTGALPYFDHNGLSCPIFTTAATKALTRIILRDAFKIGKLSHKPLGYEEKDIYKALDFMRRVKIPEGKDLQSLPGIAFDFFYAGHIPGSASIKLTLDDKNILYTGDIAGQETQLMLAPDTNWGSVDVLIIESTYGNRDHEPRQASEELFKKTIKETIAQGGSVLIPAFAIGRAQEILLIVNDIAPHVPVFIDGMAGRVTELLLHNKESVKSPEKLEQAWHRARTVRGWRERKRIAQEQGIFITTSGMLTGGPVLAYLKALRHDTKSKILLTGYQGEGTNGRMLMETGKVMIDGATYKIDCEFMKFDFSAHAGLSELKNMIKNAQPKQLIINHGDAEACEHLASFARAINIETYVPSRDQEIEIQ